MTSLPATSSRSEQAPASSDNAPANARDTPAPPPHLRPSFALLLALVAALTALRLLGLAWSSVDLFYDEAQYWNWAQDLAFGYYSKPPLLAWLLAGTRRLCGDGEFCTRAPAPVAYFVTSLLTYAATRRFYDERTAFWAGLLTALTTGIVFSARVISTDVPLLMFWALALLAYGHLLQTPRPGWGHPWSVVLGIAIGLGLLSKYAMIYFLAGMALAALASGSARALLRTRAFALALAVAVLVVLPNLIWNATHGFLTLWHTSDLVLGEDFKPGIGRAAEFLASQFGVFGPIVFAVMIIAVFRLRSDQLREPDRIMVAFFVTPLALVTVLSGVVHVYANWASVAAVSGLILTTALIVRERRMSWLYASLALGLALQATLLVGDAVAARIPARVAGFPNPYRRTLGWRAYAERAGALAREVRPATVAGDNRGDIAALRYYLRGEPFSVLSWPTSDNPYFDPVHPLTDAATEPVLLITSCPDIDRLEAYYTKVTSLGHFVATFGAGGTHAFRAFLLSERHGPIGVLQRCRDE